MAESQQRLIRVSLIVAHHVVKHEFFNSPLAQQVWCYAANIIWQLLAKIGNLGPHISCSNDVVLL